MVGFVWCECGCACGWWWVVQLLGIVGFIDTPPSPHAVSLRPVPAPTPCARAAVPPQGDLMLFVSHKYHNIEPVRRGKRVVLVAELWDGPERRCAHRCLGRGECNYTLTRSQVAHTAQNLAMLG